jgi:hypothetical protein
MRSSARQTQIVRSEELSVAEGLLTTRHSYGETIAELCARFGLSERTAKRRIAEVYERWQAESAATRDIQRELQSRSLDRLHRAAFEAQQFGVCVRIEQLIAKIHGTEQASRLVVAEGSVSSFSKEFEGRSIDDLNFYVARGFFPDKSPRSAPRQHATSGMSAMTQD